MGTRDAAAVLARRSAVLACLRDAKGAPVSGQAIADELGVTRVAVANHVAALREEGYRISSSTRTGYALEAVPDLATPLEVAPLLHGRFTNLTGGRATVSTNDDARTLALDGAPEGTVVLACEQSGGKGRLGRAWRSPKGGVYASYVLRPQVPPDQTAPLSLVAALAVADSLRELGVEDIALKWPNDVLLMPSGTGTDVTTAAPVGKLVGMLLEMSMQPEQVDYVVCGVGVNVRRPKGGALEIDDGGRLPAAHLADALDPVPCLAAVAAAQIDAMARRYDAWLAANCSFAPFRAEYEAQLAILGQDVRVSRLDGQVLADGLCIGVDDQGRLLVRSPAGDVVPVVAGDVTLRG